MRRRKKSSFRFVFFIYLCFLVVLMAAALIYVNATLREYENEHPNRHVETAVENMRREAADGTLWNTDGVPDMVTGRFEADLDAKAEFTRLINGELKYTTQKWTSETECVIGVKSGDTIIAEVLLRATSPIKQKLAIITMQEFELVSYKPVAHTYTITLPSSVKIGMDVSISVNGVALTEADAEADPITKNNKFTLENIYFTPDIKITDAFGNSANYRMPDTVNGEIEFDSCIYTLTLPESLSVTVDGVKIMGETLDDGRVLYNVRLVKKADVKITDLFGNSVDYNGASSIPLTYSTIMANEGYTVKVDGKDVPSEAISVSVNPEFDIFADYVPDLPQSPIYNIVYLKDNAEITVTDNSGNSVELDPGEKIHDLTGLLATDTLAEVPYEVSSEVNVLKIAENWSLFMSSDLDFSVLAKDLIKSSSQYEVANKYNSSVDKQFTSIHTLLDPAFTEESVKNFRWIADNCFSVDIRFVKHMKLDSGNVIDDEMNERFYFVKYDDTNDYVNNPKWKLVGMKGGVDNAE